MKSLLTFALLLPKIKKLEELQRKKAKQQEKFQVPTTRLQRSSNIQASTSRAPAPMFLPVFKGTWHDTAARRRIKSRLEFRLQAATLPVDVPTASTRNFKRHSAAMLSLVKII